MLFEEKSAENLILINNYPNILLTKTRAALSYHRVRGLYFQAAVFAVTIVMYIYYVCKII